MWETLNTRQQALLSCVQEHRRLCMAAIPDRPALGVSRWRVAQAGRTRMDYLNGTIFPAVDGAGTAADLRRIVALRDATPAYQRQVSAYVTRWSTEAIMAEWTAYQAAAKPFRAIILTRVAEEMEVLRPVLRQMALNQAKNIQF